ncbi:MAG: Superfamily and helicase [Chlamydiia bacterium]|nr:Superfamily and helicase [Chlamydiia bacterium]
METLKFADMKLSSEILQGIQSMGFEKASPIQSMTIPLILEGKDIIGQAQTGTGKTAAFGIPMIEKIDKSNKQIQGLILCPTRELAIQVAEELGRLLKFIPEVHVLPVYGGQPIEHQLKSLRSLRPQIIVGTPGRIYDHIDRKTIRLETVHMVVLDEADEMLNMGFRDAIEEILKFVKDEAQTVFFSATMPKAILHLTKTYQTNPEHVQVARQQMSAPLIEQFYLEVRNDQKIDALSRLLDLNHTKLSVVFCNTKRRVDDVVEHLERRGYLVGGLHGDLKQRDRDRVMGNFRKGTVEILVATDIAARGIDVDDIEAVYNLDLPYDEEDYVHRIGRTGRVGRKGKAFTFVVGREMNNLKRIGQFTNSKILPTKLPTVTDVEENKANQLVDKIKETIKAGGLERSISLIERIMVDETNSLDIAAALLKMLSEPKKRAKEAVEAPRDRVSDRPRSSTGNFSRGPSRDRDDRSGPPRRDDRGRDDRGPRRPSSEGFRRK